MHYCQAFADVPHQKLCNCKVYKDKKSSGCALCKPHKHGWAPKKKAKFIALEKGMDREIIKETGSSVQKI
jgi:hypothetical protein